MTEPLDYFLIPKKKVHVKLYIYACMLWFFVASGVYMIFAYKIFIKLPIAEKLISKFVVL